MKNLKRWLYMLAFSMLLLGNNFSLEAQNTYRCDNTISSITHNGNSTISIQLGDLAVNNYSNGGSIYWSDKYYYAITDQSVTSLSTTDLSNWTPLYDFSINYLALSNFNVNNVTLCAGNYKFWIMNYTCAVPVNPHAQNFTIYSTQNTIPGLTAVDQHNGKIDIAWSSSYNSQPIQMQYSVYKTSETPTIWTTTTSFYPNKIVNINTDQDGNSLALGQSYKIAAKYSGNCITYSNPFSLDLCNQTVSNIQTVDLENGKINTSWTGTTPVPADGYAWAIHEDGVTPLYPSDFRFTTGTTLTNIDTTFNNLSLVQGQNYKVTVIAVCDTNTSKSANAHSDVFQVITCTSNPSNIIATQTGDNKMAISWAASSPAPADGYKYAVVNNASNYTPVIADYTASASTSVTNILTDYDGNTLNHMNTYTIYVLGSCAVNSYTTPIDTMISINNCSNVVTGLDLTNAANAKLSLSWTAPTTAPADGYAYAVSKVGVTPVFPTNFAMTTLTSFTNISKTFDSTLVQNDVKYVVHVVAICDMPGVYSMTVRDTVTFSTCQAAPTALSATQNAGVLTINFTGNSPADGYLYAVTPINTTILPTHYVQASASPITNVTTSTNNMQPFVHNQTYIVSVKSACSLANNYVSPSVTSTITIDNCADAPTNLVINTTTDLANISWTEPTTPPTDGYMVYVGYNYNAVANYPSGFVSVLDTNGYQFQGNTDSYYVFVVSKCGSSHSTSISGNFTLVNCNHNNVNIDEITTGINGVSASWTYSGTSMPADGFAYVIIDDNYGPYPNSINEYTFIQNNMSISDVMTTFNGDTLIDGREYYIEVLGVCDSANNFYTSSYGYFDFTKCYAPTNIQMWANADSTISATWENESATVANYLYAIRNGNGSVYPLFPINYTTTTNTSVTNIATTFDNQNFIPDNYYIISVIAVCDVANNVISEGNGNSTYFDGQDCNSYTNFNAEYANDALKIIRYNNGNFIPAQGYQYAVIPSNVSINDNFYKTFVPNSTIEQNTMTGITRNTINNALIVPNQEYRMYMRGICDSLNGSFGYQDYRTFVSTNNLYCDNVSDVTASDNNNKSININWYYNGISTNGFEYAVLPIATTLQASHFVATASAPVYNVYKTTSSGDSLVSGQAYAVYVRTKCSATSFSSIESTSIALHSTLSITDIASEDLVKVYPNPVTSNLTIEIPSATTENSTVTIYDLTGKVISTSTLENAVTVLNVDDLVKGVYLISIDSKSVQKTIRIVKQ